MDKKSLIDAGSNSYVYSDINKCFLFIPDGMKDVILGKGKDQYYSEKLDFLMKNKFFDEKKTVFQTEYSEHLVKRNLASLRQLLIEVTDCCNLRCRYCGYGEFYSNYDQRETQNQTFENVKLLIDFLKELWESEYNISYNNVVSVGFYGGEPLLNMNLIKEVISYLENLNLSFLTFKYNMTTNAVLLDRYMAYLVEKDFSLLISLDGDEFQNGYRVDKCGNPSFKRVKKNALLLKKAYPEFFELNVRFNVVLHDRNSVEDAYLFINETFGKLPQISELNTNGIIPERLDEFNLMFKNKFESFAQAENYEEVKEAYKMEDSRSIVFHSMLMNYAGNRYTSYTDLFEYNEELFLPTSTCRPFERKLFLTVNGKIFPCEKIGQGYPVGNLKRGKVGLDCSSVAELYNSLYRKVIKNCSNCSLKRACRQCLFLLKEKHGKLICPYMLDKKGLRAQLSDFLLYAEHNPEEYERLLSSIVID